MKKIFILLIPLTLSYLPAFPQTMSITHPGHHVVYDDEFDYIALDAITPVPATTTGTNAGTTFWENWTTTIPGFGNTTVYNNSIYPDVISLRTPKGLTLKEHTYSSSIPVSDGGSYRIADHLAGGLVSNATHTGGNHEWGFGVYEASIRIVCDPGTTYTGTDGRESTAVASSAFWTRHDAGNEIDILDGSVNYSIHNANIDWHYGGGLPSNRETGGCVARPSTHGYIPGTVTEYYDDDRFGTFCEAWHIYSVVKTPTSVKFYIDGIYTNQIDYSHVRIYPGFDHLELAIGANSNTGDGRTMDIDYVKVWRPDCVSGDFNVNISNYGSQLPNYPYLPDFLKYQTIEINVPNGHSMPTIIPGKINGTTDINGYGVSVLTGEAVTILPDFLADESVLQNGDVILTNCNLDPQTSTLPQINNGYFEVVSLGRDGCNIDNLVTTNHAWYRQPPVLDSVNKNTPGDIKVLPNPTTNNITIAYQCSTTGLLQIAVKDVSGRVMYTRDVNCNANSNVLHTIDLKDYVSGIYFVDMTINDQHMVKKIVKL